MKRNFMVVNSYFERQISPYHAGLGKNVVTKK